MDDNARFSAFSCLLPISSSRHTLQGDSSTIKQLYAVQVQTWRGNGYTFEVRYYPDYE